MTRRRWIYPSDGSPAFEVSDAYTPEPRGPMVFGDLPAYESPIDGRVISGRAARRDDMARHGCRPWEGMAQERNEASRRETYQRERMERKLDETVNRSWAQISERSRRALSEY